MFGSYDFYRAAFDLDGKIDKARKLQYRLNVMGMKRRSFVKYDYNDRLLIAPVLKYQINNRTYVSAEYIYQKFEYAMQSPILMMPNGFASLPRDFPYMKPALHPASQPTKIFL